MIQFYECKVKHRKVDENGAMKVVTELFLVAAVSYTDAEMTINRKMNEYTSEPFKVTGIRLTNYAEVHNFHGSDTWFKSKVSLVAYDEESGKEKKVNIFILVQADDAKMAYENTVEAMKGSMGDYTIPAVSETKILEVFKISHEV